ncbi:pectate lyase-like adhesive domain-containing protein [Isobaculum melis]|uniref:Bacterial Ig domain-containing protein n=1 Tax=Isobaculum melis TaxID=142588 RepID=A0A1H9TBN9_9LACT|nr:pectate lyase-like adhesive domain-containing protein [Isobaculum melis]SER94538.1 hypothetical protein SAMN04488559_11212 [Isobaculum melis]
MKQKLNKLSVIGLLTILLFTITPITSIASDKLPSSDSTTTEELPIDIDDTPTPQVDYIEEELEEETSIKQELNSSEQQPLEEIPVQTEANPPVQQNKSVTNRSSAIVTNYDELKMAIEYYSVAEVILGADIELTGRIDLPNQDIIINGNGYKLTQKSTTTYLRLTLGNGLHIELKNMEASAKTFYGMVSVADSCTDINLTINQVIFHGPQLTFNRKGTINFVGNNQIFIEPTAGGDTNQEVAEVMNVVFKADTTTTISHESSSDAVFWLGGAGYNDEKKILIEDHATVDITTNNTLSYADFSSPTLNLGTSASFTLKAARGTGSRMNQIRSVSVGQSASLTITDHPTTNSNVPLLKVETSITLDTDSSLDVTSAVGRSNLIHFNKAEGSITATNPKYLNLSNNGANLINTISGQTLSFYYSAENVNHWQRPLAGKVLPTGIWSTPDSSSLNIVSIKGSANADGTTGGATATTLLHSTIQEYAPAFDLYERFSVGSGKILLNDVGDNHSVITGSAMPNIQIIITYLNEDDTMVTLNGMSDETGTFSIPTVPIAADTTVTAYSAPANMAVAKAETTVKDLTPPTANPVTQIVPINTNLTDNPENVIADLKDNLSLKEKIKVTFSADENKQPKLDKIGLTYAYVTLEDEANNATDIKVPVFVTSGDSKTSANLNEAIYGEDFTIKRSQVTGDMEAIKTLVFNQAKILAWNKDQYLTKEELTITLDPKLTNQSEAGVYTATFAYGGITHTIYVTVLDSTELISVKIPVKMLFGSMDIDAGNIHSPTYAIENQSPFAVNVVLQEIQEIDNDGLSLIKQGIPNQTEQRAKLDLSIEQNSSQQKVEYLAPNLTQPLDIATLEKENGQAKLSFSGFYYGDYQEVLKPAYQFKLKFSPIE